MKDKYNLFLYGFVWLFSAFIGDYFIVHQILYLDTDKIDLKKILIESPGNLIYLIFFPILTATLIPRYLKVNKFLIGILGIAPILTRILLVAANIHFFPFQKFSELDYKYIKFSITNWDFIGILFVMFSISILFQYLSQYHYKNINENDKHLE